MHATCLTQTILINFITLIFDEEHIQITKFRILRTLWSVSKSHHTCNGYQKGSFHTVHYLWHIHNIVLGWAYNVTLPTVSSGTSHNEDNTITVWWNEVTDTSHWCSIYGFINVPFKIGNKGFQCRSQYRNQHSQHYCVCVCTCVTKLLTMHYLMVYYRTDSRTTSLHNMYVSLLSSQAAKGAGDQTGLTQKNSATGNWCIHNTITLALHQEVLQWQVTTDVHRLGSMSRVVTEFLPLLDTAAERFRLLPQSA